MKEISRELTVWYEKNKRDLPWRKTQDPYQIWLSEILLQQTRVDQGLNYYLAFVENYPLIQDLAEASEDEVLALWKGLGYYSRGRNLRKAAIQIVEDFGGVFPNNFNDIKKLKGVGDYSASAIASFAFKEPKAVLDGNVYRLLSRLFGIDTPIDTTQGKRVFQALADELLDQKQPDLHNQAIMEFGALQCTPKKTDCSVCPLIEKCIAYEQGMVGELPIKAKRIVKKDRYFVFSFHKTENGILFEKRGDKDIWANMYQLPLKELQSKEEWEEINKALWRGKHVLTHQNLWCVFIENQALKAENYLEISSQDFQNFAFPVIIENFLKNQGV